MYIDFNSRGIYTGDQTLVVLNKDGETEVYGYDNVNDPEQLNRIPYTKVKNGDALKTELEYLLKTTGDKWATDKICADFLNY